MSAMKDLARIKDQGRTNLFRTFFWRSSSSAALARICCGMWPGGSVELTCKLQCEKLFDAYASEGVLELSMVVRGLEFARVGTECGSRKWLFGNRGTATVNSPVPGVALCVVPRCDKSASRNSVLHPICRRMKSGDTRCRGECQAFSNQRIRTSSQKMSGGLPR